MALTRAWPRSSLRPTIATEAPAAPSPSAMAPPSDPVAPMTTADSPFRLNKSIIVAGLWDKAAAWRRNNFGRPRRSASSKIPRAQKRLASGVEFDYFIRQ
jgi:hypothetical protein